MGPLGLGFLVFLVCLVAFGILSASRFIRWRVDQRVIATRIGRRGQVVRSETVELLGEEDAEQIALATRLPRLQLLLIEAGSSLTLSRILVRSIVLGGLGAFMTAAVAPGILANSGILLTAVPWLLIIRARARRSNLVRRTLPRAIEHMVTALRAGQSLPDAIGVAGAATAAPLGPELMLVAEESKLGLQLRTSFDDMLVRLPEMLELRILVAAVLLNVELGGNLVESLDFVVKTLRQRRIYEAKLHASTSEARISAFVVGATPIVTIVMMALAAPDYIALLFEPGFIRTLLLGSTVWMMVGILVMAKLSSGNAQWQS